MDASQRMDLLAQVLRDTQLSSSDMLHQLLNPALVKTPRNTRTPKNQRNRQFQDLLEPMVNSDDVPPPPTPTVLSTTYAPEGGKIVAVRHPEGRVQVRIEYDRDEFLHCAKSPFALLPPASIKDVIVNMPEIIAPFPVRHGVSQ